MHFPQGWPRHGEPSSLHGRGVPPHVRPLRASVGAHPEARKRYVLLLMSSLAKPMWGLGRECRAGGAVLPRVKAPTPPTQTDFGAPPPLTTSQHTTLVTMPCNPSRHEPVYACRGHRADCGVGRDHGLGGGGLRFLWVPLLFVCGICVVCAPHPHPAPVCPTLPPAHARGHMCTVCVVYVGCGAGAQGGGVW